MTINRRTVTVDSKPKSEKLEWKRYRERPVIVNAVQMDMPFRVETQGGIMISGEPGDWLVESMKGMLRLCKDGVFQAVYEAVQGND